MTREGSGPARLQEDLKPGDVVLFKGSHGMHLEQIIDAVYVAE